MDVCIQFNSNVSQYEFSDEHEGYYVLKVLSQWLHTYGVSPVCGHMWFFKPGIHEKALLQWLQ